MGLFAPAHSIMHIFQSWYLTQQAAIKSFDTQRKSCVETSQQNHFDLNVCAVNSDDDDDDALSQSSLPL